MIPLIMRNLIIFTILLMLSIDGVSGQGVDSNNSRIEKIKVQLSTYLHDGFLSSGVDFIQNCSPDLEQRMALYDYYLPKIKEYLRSRVPDLNNSTVEKDRSYYEEQNGGYTYLWAEYPEEAEKAQEKTRERFNTKDHVWDLIDKKEMGFIIRKREELRAVATKPSDYEKIDKVVKDSVGAINNIKNDLLEKSKINNSEQMVTIVSKADAVLEEVKDINTKLNSCIVNQYLDLEGYDLFIYNTYNHTNKKDEIPVRKVEKTDIPLLDYLLHPFPTIKARLGGNTIVTKKVPLAKYKNNLIESISSINGDMIHAVDNVTRKKYLNTFQTFKSNFETNEFSSFQEAQKVFDSVSGNNVPLK